MPKSIFFYSAALCKTLIFQQNSVGAGFYSARNGSRPFRKIRNWFRRSAIYASRSYPNDRIDIYCLRTVSTLKFTHFCVGAGFYSARNVYFPTFSYHRVSPTRRERPACRSAKTCIFQWFCATNCVPFRAGMTNFKQTSNNHNL